MLSKLDGRAWRWLSPAAADGFEPVFSRSWGPNAPSRPGRAAGSCPRWESSKANLIWTRVCSHQYHQLVQAEHSVYPVKYRDTWYLCPLGNPDIAANLICDRDWCDLREREVAASQDGHLPLAAGALLVREEALAHHRVRGRLRIHASRQEQPAPDPRRIGSGWV